MRALVIMTILLFLPLVTRAGLKAHTPRPFPNPCGGPSGLLAELDRPTVADSACVVRTGRTIVEFGFADAYTGRQESQNAPQAEIRFGLPDHNEFVLLPPNATFADGGRAGPTDYSATVMGIKHEWGYTRRFTYTSEILLTTPTSTGTPARTTGWGAAANGIIALSLTHAVGVGLMLGVTSLYDEANRRYTSINPDFTATWLLNPRWQLYGEVYGQTHVAYGVGSGWDCDGGVQYLVTRRIEVDAEVGQRLSGALGGYRHYWGVGGGWEF